MDADMAGFAAEKDTIRETLRQERAKERLDLFMDSVKTRLTAEKKLKVNDDLLKKLAAAMKRS
jgi:type III secretory pathway component EscR